MKKPALSAWAVDDADEDTKRAFIALGQRVASDRQQAIVVNWLVHNICRTHDISARPQEMGGAEATYLAEGRRLVGLQVIKLMNQSLVAARPAVEATKPETATNAS